MTLVVFDYTMNVLRSFKSMREKWQLKKMYEDDDTEIMFDDDTEIMIDLAE